MTATRRSHRRSDDDDEDDSVANRKEKTAAKATEARAVMLERWRRYGGEDSSEHGRETYRRGIVPRLGGCWWRHRRPATVTVRTDSDGYNKVGGK